MARPQIQIKWDDFDKLCALQASLEEIASWFNCSVDTIERAVKREHKLGFAEYFAQKRGQGRISLRRAQFQAAMAGNSTMLVWLGKQWLEQKDESRVSGGDPFKVIVEYTTDANSPTET